MPKLSELRRKERPLEIDWFVDENTNVPFHIVYDPSQVTMDSNDIPEDMTLRQWWEQRTMKFVRSWDLTDDNGVEIPITHEGMRKVEQAMIQVILSSIQADAGPNRPSTTTT